MSVKLTMNMGNSSFGLPVGILSIHENLPTTDLYTPASLKFSGLDDQVDKITANNLLRQVKSAAALADVVTSNAFKYAINFYAATNVGAISNGLHTFSGSPYVSWSVENPNPSTNDYYKIRIVETPGSHANTNDYEWIPANQGWSLTSGNGLRRELHENSNFVAADILYRVQVTEVREGMTDAFVSASTNTYAVTPVGELLVKEERDGVTTRAYYDSGLVSSIDYPDGFRQAYTYDSQGRVLTLVEPFMDQTSSTQGRKTTYDYSTIGLCS